MLLAYYISLPQNQKHEENMAIKKGILIIALTSILLMSPPGVSGVSPGWSGMVGVLVLPESPCPISDVRLHRCTP